MNAGTHRQLTGRPGVAGAALGHLRHVDPPVSAPVPASASGVTGDPVAAVLAAFDAATADLTAMAAELRRAGQAEPADIADTTALIAEDTDLRDGVLSSIQSGHSADAAVSHVAEEFAGTLAALPDPTLAARAADVRAVGRRVRARLRGQAPQVAGAGPAALAVLSGYEVTADDLLTAGTGLAGAVSTLGGASAHTAIVARALGVPVVFGVDLRGVPEGTELVIDGATGTVVVAPRDAERAAAVAATRTARARRDALAAQRGSPCRTRDGWPVTLLANVGSVVEADAAVAAGAAGVGLLRTEMPFLSAPRWPTRAEHVAALAPVLRQFAGAAVTVRTLDFAADKLPPFLRGEGHGSPSTTRGLALMLAAGDAFADQFRAILEAGSDVDLRVMIPMVSGVTELRACRALLAKAATEAGIGPPALGAMVELPEAVAAAGDLAAEADFLSIGSNDLTAAILGLDRRDPALTPALAAEPAVLRAIAAVVEAGARYGTPISVCGDAAADPTAAPLLVGLGVDTLSVAPAALDEVRALVRDVDRTAMRVTSRASAR